MDYVQVLINAVSIVALSVGMFAVMRMPIKALRGNVVPSLLVFCGLITLLLIVAPVKIEAQQMATADTIVQGVLAAIFSYGLTSIQAVRAFLNK